VKVFFDHNMSPRMARALRELFGDEHQISILSERFSRTTPDTVWIDALSREGRWVIISGDRRITRNRAEYAAFRSSRLVGFFLFRGLYKTPVAKQTDRHLVGERLLRAGVKLHIMRPSAVAADAACVRVQLAICVPPTRRARATSES
jgi:PIN like domain